jgi:hypothetical protein
MQAHVGNYMKTRGFSVLSIVILLAAIALAEELPPFDLQHRAPPPAPPIVVRSGSALDTPEPPAGGGGSPTLHSIGQPTDEEQLYLEYINRARANPTAEGMWLAGLTEPNVLSAYSFFGVDLSLMQSQFAGIAAAPPVAFHSLLIDAARWHSQDMFLNMYQGHDQTNDGVTRTAAQRLTFYGYNWSTVGENVYSYSQNVLYGHAGFNVDWGPGTGGMQTPPGHRNNIHSPAFREVGIGVVNGTNGSVGPQLVTQDFATQLSATPLITGVSYYDFNGNNFYDVGEGIGGLTVSVTGSSYYAVTSNSGGFAVPVPGNGSYTVAFSGPSIFSETALSISSQLNSKVDLVPTYTPPMISGVATPVVGRQNPYNFSTVGGATAYQWFSARRVSYSAVEGGESGLGAVTIVSSPGYSMLDSSVKHAGANSFHFAHPDAADQVLTLTPFLLPRAGSELTFYKRLGWASTSQVAKAQISLDGGIAWQDLWQQSGTGGSGDSTFSQVTVSLGAYAGKFIRIRFLYQRNSGSYFPQTDAGIGFYVDDIAITHADELLDFTITTVPSGLSFSFNPGSVGGFALGVRGQLPGRTLAWGPVTSLTGTFKRTSGQITSQ